MKTYLLIVRQYEIMVNDYIIKVYKVTTDNIYRIIGKMYCTALEKIDRIDYVEWQEKREKFWQEHGYTVREYKEPIRLRKEYYRPRYCHKSSRDR